MDDLLRHETLDEKQVYAVAGITREAYPPEKSVATAEGEAS